MVSNKKLGKGLSSLLGNKADYNVENKNEKGLLLIPIEKIFRDEQQPRKEFNQEKINELAESIKSKGLVQPILVRPSPTESGTYEIIAGERRWRAAQIAQLHEVPAVVRLSLIHI